MDDWSEEQVEAQRAALLALRETLVRTRGETRQSASTVDLDQPIGRLSRMDALQQQKMAEARQRRHEQRLKMVRAALRRAEQGEYGACADCGEPVGYKRLQARPETPFCVPCQAERER